MVVVPTAEVPTVEVPTAEVPTAVVPTAMVPKVVVTYEAEADVLVNVVGGQVAWLVAPWVVPQAMLEAT